MNNLNYGFLIKMVLDNIEVQPNKRW